MDEPRPIISIIAAVADNGTIGQGKRLPWHLPADLKHFKSLTLGKPVIMGRRTWESLPGPLPQRTPIVVTADRDYPADRCLVVHSIPAALAAAGGVPEVMVAGGAALYAQFLPLAHRMYLTRVHGDFQGDVVFPSYPEQEWLEVASQTRRADDSNAYSYTFVTLERKDTAAIRHPSG